MVSAYSKVPDAAADLVRFLASEEEQKDRALVLGEVPTPARPLFRCRYPSKASVVEESIRGFE